MNFGLCTITNSLSLPILFSAFSCLLFTCTLYSPSQQAEHTSGFKDIQLPSSSVQLRTGGWAQRPRTPLFSALNVSIHLYESERRSCKPSQAKPICMHKSSHNHTVTLTPDIGHKYTECGYRVMITECTTTLSLDPLFFPSGSSSCMMVWSLVIAWASASQAVHLDADLVRY